MSVSLRENITAVIETCFSETKDEIQDTAINRILELIRADRNSSEKPNNCETCKNWDIVNDHCYFIQECHYEPKTEPTRSKMEQVDKDTNVRSKDCTTCRFDDKYGEESICSDCSRHYSDCYEPKDEHSGEVTEMVEPQTERHLPDYSYEADFGKRIMEQTDCPQKGESQ